ncbi:RidA family protein [Streptomyces lydicus]|uniref:RidA family protein n=1 Tax=Streptomyces lydicus TaxID=47763 RepID=UPI0037A3A9F9
MSAETTGSEPGEQAGTGTYGAGPRADGDESGGPGEHGPERINPPHLAPPTGFSHAVRAAPGTLVFLAGQTALDGSGKIVGDGIVEQFERALTNLLEVAAAAGAGPSDLAKLTVFAVDVADYRRHARELGRVWKRLVGSDFPAMAVIGATRLWDETALVEIEGIAVVRER